MPATTAPTPKPSRSFTSWKLDILSAVGADPRVPSSHFRMFARVLAALNEHSRVAIIGDNVLADEVPGFKVQSTCYRARQRLKDLGYWTFEEGRGSRATRYTISDEPTAAVLEAIKQARERRNQERESRRGAMKRRTPNHAMVHGNEAVEPCKTLSPNHAEMQVVHPQGTPSPSPLPETVQDVAKEAHDTVTGEVVTCSECDRPAVVRCGLVGDTYCQEHRWLATQEVVLK